MTPREPICARIKRLQISLAKEIRKHLDEGGLSYAGTPDAEENEQPE
jgi:hypothetical protein